MLALGFVESRIKNLKLVKSVGSLVRFPECLEVEVFFSNIYDFVPLLAGIARYLVARSTSTNVDDEKVAGLGIFRGSYLDGVAVLGCRNKNDVDIEVSIRSCA